MPARRLVHIVDDDSDVRRSLGVLLRANGYVPHLFADGRAFLDAIGGLDAGCVLLDLRLSGMDGLEILESLAHRTHLVRAVIVTGHADVGTAVQAMKLGASDFVEKPFDDGQILAILSRIFAEIEAEEPSFKRHEQARQSVAKLSPRERDVLIGLMTGQSNKVLAHELGLSARTVEMHRAHMMDRLGVTSLPDALRIAFEAGLFPSNEG
jgi:two-component system response regulator FixJ